jgi:hypothetical protein
LTDGPTCNDGRQDMTSTVIPTVGSLREGGCTARCCIVIVVRCVDLIGCRSCRLQVRVPCLHMEEKA